MSCLRRRQSKGDSQNEKYHVTWILTAYGGDGSGVCNSTADGMREEK